MSIVFLRILSHLQTFSSHLSPGRWLSFLQGCQLLSHKVAQERRLTGNFEQEIFVVELVVLGPLFKVKPYHASVVVSFNLFVRLAL